MKRIIECPFNVNDSIYWITSLAKYKSITCPICLGDGTLKRNNDEIITCPKCNGVKSIDSSNHYHWQEPKLEKIKKIGITINEYDVKFTYYFHDRGGFESEVFATKEDTEKFIIDTNEKFNLRWNE